MKKTSKILSLILGVTMAASAVPSISASADYRYYPKKIVTIKEPPVDYEYCQDTDLYKNHKEYFTMPIVYRSVSNKNLFAGFYKCSFNYLHLQIKSSKWVEIYNKYKNKLELACGQQLPDNSVSMSYTICDSDYESTEEFLAAIDKQCENVEKIYEIVMNMCAEMYEAGYISGATYLPVAAPEAFHFETTNIDVDVLTDENITIEEVQDVVNSVTDKMTLKGSDGCFRIHNDGTADDYFAVVDALKEKFGDRCEINDYIMREIEIWTKYDARYDIKPIDIIAELEVNAGIAYGDANIDNHIGIQDAVLMNKSIVGAVNFNKDQNKVTDLNGDNVVDSEDLTILLRYLVDDIDTLPVAE